MNIMNLLKKSLAVISSAIICASVAIPFTGSALYVPGTAGTLDNVIAELGENAYIHINESYYDRSMFAITEEGEGCYYNEFYRKTTVTVKDGEKLPVDEINQKLGPMVKEFSDFCKLQENDDGGYILRIRLIEDRSAAYEILSSYDAVVSIDEHYEISKQPEALWTFEGVWLPAEYTLEEAIDSFPELNIVEKVMEYNKLSAFKFKDIITYDNCTREVYNAMKKLDESGVEYSPRVAVAEIGLGDQVSSGTVNVYKAEEAVTTTTTTTETAPETTTTTTVSTKILTEPTITNKTNTTPKTGTGSPKTGDAGVAGIVVAGIGAVAAAFALRKREN